MSPERRRRMIEAILAIQKELDAINLVWGAEALDLELLSNTELTVCISNIETHIERAQATEV